LYFHDLGLTWGGFGGLKKLLSASGQTERVGAKVGSVNDGAGRAWKEIICHWNRISLAHPGKSAHPHFW
jgi:hypothetical protein